MWNNNNCTEEINEELKCEDLQRCLNLPTCKLLIIISEDFLPRRYERYVKMNVQFYNGFKKPQNEIYLYLRNCPTIIVDDILNKMKQLSPVMIQSEQRLPTVPQTTFSVKGDFMHRTEMRTYCVDFGTKKHFIP